MLKNTISISLMAILLLLVACGGGDSTPPAETGSNWNDMVWDRDNWQ